MKDGFTVLSKLPADQLTMVSSIALDAVRTPFKVDIDDLAKHLAISKDEAGALLSAVSLLTVFVSGRKDKPEDLVEAAVQANLVPETSRQATLDFSRTLAVQRETLKQDIEKARIAGRVLPGSVLNTVLPHFGVAF
jgi:acetylglutamate kinase